MWLAPGLVAPTQAGAVASENRSTTQSGSQSVARTMRICHVIESSSGGSCRIVLALLRDQLEAGHDVALIYSPLRSEAFFTNAIAALQPRLRVRTTPMARTVGPHDLLAAWRLHRALTALGPFDVIHGHSSKGGALTRIAGLALKRSAIIYMPHAFVTMAPAMSRIYRGVEWLASWFCDAIVVGSQQEYDHARNELRVPASRLRLIRLGIDLAWHGDREKARAALGLSPEIFTVGFVGRLAAQKNPMRLAHVIKIAASARPDLRFVVVGDGELTGHFLEALSALDLRRRTIVAPDADGREMMAAFDCLVCTSDYESFGLIFPEALASGAPIVSPPVGVAHEAIIEGETGVLTSFDAESIAQGVLEIAAKSERDRARMTASCRAQAPNFDILKMADAMRALYSELVARKSSDA